VRQKGDVNGDDKGRAEDGWRILDRMMHQWREADGYSTYGAGRRADRRYASVGRGIASVLQGGRAGVTQVCHLQWARFVRKDYQSRSPLMHGEIDKNTI